MLKICVYSSLAVRQVNESPASHQSGRRLKASAGRAPVSKSSEVFVCVVQPSDTTCGGAPLMAAMLSETCRV